MDENLVKFKRLRNIMLFAFFLLIVSGIRLQIIEGKKYYRLSDENRIRKRYIPAPRGRILDRYGFEIANSRPGFYVSIIKAIVDSSTLAKITPILATDEKIIREKMQMEKNPFMPVKVAHDISFEQLSIIEEDMDELKGVEVGIEPLRNYPYREIFCHLLGYVGEITEQEIKKDPKYTLGDYLGRMGIEESNESSLKGSAGIEYIEVDARGREVGKISEKRPEPVINGQDLHTTIDLGLTESVAVYLKEYEKAACVCLDPKTGEVLVLYSKPGFDPNLFAPGLKKDQWLNLNNDPDAPMYNRAIMSCYPCGSTFKPFVALAALDAGMVNKDKRFEPCHGEYRLGTRIFKCWKTHGSLDFVNAIINSCDIYFYQLGRFIGVDTITKRAEMVGFGRATKIDLPSEKMGLLPSRKWFENRYGKHWTEGHILNLSIGQGDLLVTPLQLAYAFTVFANNGEMPVPHLVKDTKVAINQPNLSKDAIAIVNQGLQGVVAWGTGTLARVRNIAVCGKTGTAQNPHGEDHALFVGFAPANNPQILVCVIVENAGHGGSIAAPIAGKIMQIYLQKIAGPESVTKPSKQNLSQL